MKNSVRMLECDRRLAEAFPCTVIHLHNTSLFLLDLYLQIDGINCFQINMDISGMTFEEEIPYLKENTRCRALYTYEG